MLNRIQGNRAPQESGPPFSKYHFSLSGQLLALAVGAVILPEAHILERLGVAHVSVAVVKAGALGSSAVQADAVRLAVGAGDLGPVAIKDEGGIVTDDVLLSHFRESFLALVVPLTEVGEATSHYLGGGEN